MSRRGKTFFAFVVVLEVLGFAGIAIEIAILAADSGSPLHWLGIFGGTAMAAGGALYAKGFKFFSRI